MARKFGLVADRCTDAADAFGISFRAYRYLEAAVTSRGRPLEFIPKLTELACAELARREEIANPRRAFRRLWVSVRAAAKKFPRHRHRRIVATDSAGSSCRNPPNRGDRTLVAGVSPGELADEGGCGFHR